MAFQSAGKSIAQAGLAAVTQCRRRHGLEASVWRLDHSGNVLSKWRGPDPTVGVVIANDYLWAYGISTNSYGGSDGSFADLFQLDLDTLQLLNAFNVSGEVEHLVTDGENAYTIDYLKKFTGPNTTTVRKINSSGAQVWSKVFSPGATVERPVRLHYADEDNLLCRLRLQTATNEQLHSLDPDNGSTNWSGTTPGDEAYFDVTSDGSSIWGVGAFSVDSANSWKLNMGGTVQARAQQPNTSSDPGGANPLILCHYFNSDIYMAYDETPGSGIPCIRKTDSSLSESWNIDGDQVFGHSNPISGIPRLGDMDDDGTNIWVCGHRITGDGSVWGSNGDTASIWQIDEDGDVLIAVDLIEGSSLGVAANANSVYVATALAEHVSS